MFESAAESKSPKNIFVTVLRWIAVLPGSLLATLLIMFPIHWVVMWIHTPGEDGPSILAVIPAEMMEYWAYAFSTPCVLVIVGSLIAPKFQFYTGIALAILWGILFVATFALVISYGGVEGWTWARLAVSCALGIAGVSVGLVKSYELEFDEDDDSA